MENLLHLRELVKKETAYTPADEVVDRFLNAGTISDLQPGEIFIETGEVNDNIFTVADGIIRFADMNGLHERTTAFALPGTVFMSKHCFVYGLPSYYRMEACCKSTLIAVSKEKFWKMADEDPRFSIWMLHLAYEELFFQEYKNSAVNNGSAKERFEALLSRRPEIFGKVTLKVIASYLGITPEYLCRLRKKH